MNGTIKYKINDAILAQTQKCVRNFECLDPDTPNCLNKVLICLSQQVYFVDCAEDCIYNMPFGSGVVCQCPVRKEIYNKYDQ
jgi:hypothetical protein